MGKFTKVMDNLFTTGLSLTEILVLATIDRHRSFDKNHDQPIEMTAKDFKGISKRHLARMLNKLQSLDYIDHRRQRNGIYVFYKSNSPPGEQFTPIYDNLFRTGLSLSEIFILSTVFRFSRRDQSKDGKVQMKRADFLLDRQAVMRALKKLSNKGCIEYHCHNGNYIFTKWSYIELLKSPIGQNDTAKPKMKSDIGQNDTATSDKMIQAIGQNDTPSPCITMSNKDLQRGDTIKDTIKDTIYKQSITISNPKSSSLFSEGIRKHFSEYCSNQRIEEPITNQIGEKHYASLADFFSDLRISKELLHRLKTIDYIDFYILEIAVSRLLSCGYLKKGFTDFDRFLLKNPKLFDILRGEFGMSSEKELAEYGNDLNNSLSWENYRYGKRQLMREIEAQTKEIAHFEVLVNECKPDGKYPNPEKYPRIIARLQSEQKKLQSLEMSLSKLESKRPYFSLLTPSQLRKFKENRPKKQANRAMQTEVSAMIADLSMEMAMA